MCGRLVGTGGPVGGAGHVVTELLEEGVHLRCRDEVELSWWELCSGEEKGAFLWVVVDIAALY